MTRKDLVNYLDAIQMGASLIGTVANLQEDSLILADQKEFSGVFISDVVDQAGTRQYTTLHFMNDRLIVEIPNFVSNPVFHIVGFRNMETLELHRLEYDFKNYSSKSRLSAIIRFVGMANFILNLQASGVNCDYLLRFLHRYCIPSMIRLGNNSALGQHSE